MFEGCPLICKYNANSVNVNNRFHFTAYAHWLLLLEVSGPVPNRSQYYLWFRYSARLFQIPATATFNQRIRHVTGFLRIYKCAANSALGGSAYLYLRCMPMRIASPSLPWRAVRERQRFSWRRRRVLTRSQIHPLFDHREAKWKIGSPSGAVIAHIFLYFSND